MQTFEDPVPVRGELNAVRIFTGLLPFERGGEPVNDFERYAALSDAAKDVNTVESNEYKVLMSLGPFPQLMPGAAIEIHAAYACGEGLAGLLDNAAMAAYVYRGIWYDVDGRPQTGVRGRETPVAGPVDAIDPDACDDYEENLRLRRGDTLWTNADCEEENEFYGYSECYRGALLFKDYQTGVDGKETQIHWVTGPAPPPPAMRAVAGDGMVSVFWDNLSEITRDPVTMRYDFEGYQNLAGRRLAPSARNDRRERAERRPVASCRESEYRQRTPARQRFQETVFRRGVRLRASRASRRPRDPHRRVRAAPGGRSRSAPCPPGLASGDGDTLEALARWNLGLEGGRRYYQYVDTAPKNGMPYFYAVVAYDHLLLNGRPEAIGVRDTPISNFVYVEPYSPAQTDGAFDPKEIFVVPNPVTKTQTAPSTSSRTTTIRAARSWSSAISRSAAA